MTTGGRISAGEEGSDLFLFSGFLFVAACLLFPLHTSPSLSEFLRSLVTIGGSAICNRRFFDTRIDPLIDI